jgi:hypothetical protein
MTLREPSDYPYAHVYKFITDLNQQKEEIDRAETKWGLNAEFQLFSSYGQG